MRPIDPDVLAQLGKSQFIPAILVEINFDPGPDSFFFTSWTSELSYGGDIFHPRGLEFGPISYGASAIVDHTSIVLSDVDRQVYFKVKDIDTTLEQEAIIYVSVLRADYSILGTSILWKGFISGWGYSGGITSLRLVSIMDRWKNITSSKYSSSCRWKVFKGSECKYTGSSSWCDRNYDTCDSYGNTSNFGGFRFIPKIQNRIRRANDQKE